MKFSSTSIAGVAVVETKPFTDQRGAFARLFCADELEPLLGPRKILQINYSRTSAAGAVRGMHLQKAPQAEMKFVRCLRGRIWDVAVDLRAGSPSFLHWHAEELDAGSMRMLAIPEGCAHGFQALEPDTELLYLHTAFYTPAVEAGIRFDDPRIGIRWPLPVTDLSTRDQQHPLLADNFAGIAL